MGFVVLIKSAITALILLVSASAVAVPLPPTGMMATMSDRGVLITLPLSGLSTEKINVYRDNEYLTTLTLRLGEASTVSWLDETGLLGSAYTIVSVDESSGESEFSLPSDPFAVVMSDHQTCSAVEPIVTANTIESLLALGSIGLSAGDGDHVCIVAQISVNDVVELPSANFCFEIDKQF